MVAHAVIGPVRALSARAPRAWRRLAMLVVVLTPVLAAALYALALATPQYQAEASFMIRGREEAAAARPSLFTLGASAGPQAMDGFAVAEFARSHDALRRLRARLDYDAIMTRAGRDPLMRFSAPAGSDADLRYFNRMVDVRFSMTKQIVTLRVSAFRPEDAAAIVEAMLDIVEEFANVMNERARADMLRVAQREVEAAAQEVKERQAAIQQWRLANNNIDPARVTEMIMQSISQVEQALIEARIDLARLNTLVEPGARGRDLAARIDVLTEELVAQQRRLTGGGDDSAARQAMEYERLLLAQTISQDLYAAAVEALAEARTEANRQQKFIVVISSPVADDSPDWPDPAATIGLAALAGLFSWWILRFLYEAATDGFYG